MHEWPVSDEDMDAIADAALGPDPALEPDEEFLKAGSDEDTGFYQTVAKARKRTALLANAPSVRDILSDRRKRKFLQALAVTGNVGAACAAAGWTRTLAYSSRKGDKDFAEKWDNAVENAADLLELEAHRRAVHGVKKGVYHKGELVDYETVYSDGLLTTLLKGNRPEKFGNKIDVGVTSKGGVLVVPAAPSTSDWEQQAASGQARFRESTEEK